MTGSFSLHGAPRADTYRMTNPQTVVLHFTSIGAAARVKLLWGKAPRTCAAIANLVPTRGEAHHAIYSGSECVFLLPQLLQLSKEHATSQVRKGDVAFTWMAAGAAYGVDADFAEICWFYDIDAEPRMWGGPVEVNVFGEIVEPADDFYAACFKLRRAGAQPFALESDAP